MILSNELLYTFLLPVRIRTKWVSPWVQSFLNRRFEQQYTRNMIIHDSIGIRTHRVSCDLLRLTNTYDSAEKTIVQYLPIYTVMFSKRRYRWRLCGENILISNRNDSRIKRFTLFTVFVERKKTTAEQPFDPRKSAIWTLEDVKTNLLKWI